MTKTLHGVNWSVGRSTGGLRFARNALWNDSITCLSGKRKLCASEDGETLRARTESAAIVLIENAHPERNAILQVFGTDDHPSGAD